MSLGCPYYSDRRSNFEAPNPARMNNINFFVLNCNILMEGLCLNGLSRQALGRILINNEPGGQIISTPEHPHSIDITNLKYSSYNNLTIWLTSDTDKSISTSEPYSFRLRITTEVSRSFLRGLGAEEAAGPWASAGEEALSGLQSAGGEDVAPSSRGKAGGRTSACLRFLSGRSLSLCPTALHKKQAPRLCCGQFFAIWPSLSICQNNKLETTELRLTYWNILLNKFLNNGNLIIGYQGRAGSVHPFE